MKNIRIKFLILSSFMFVCFFVGLTPSKATSDGELMANGKPDYQYEGQVIRVIDADTLRVKAHISPGLEQTVDVRVRGIDSPELKTKCKNEKELAKEAKKIVEKHFLPDTWVYIEGIGKDGFGRVVAHIKKLRSKYPVNDGWLKIDELLLARGLAVPYEKKEPFDWCNYIPSE